MDAFFLFSRARSEYIIPLGAREREYKEVFNAREERLDKWYQLSHGREHEKLHCAYNEIGLVATTEEDNQTLASVKKIECISVSASTFQISPRTLLIWPCGEQNWI